MLRPFLRAVPGILVLSILIWASGCPGPGPVPPAPACNPFTEDNLDAEEHCSVDKADCERVLSKTLSDAHQGRCPVPPCGGFSAWTVCKPTGRECAVDETTFGQIFKTEEHVRCK